MTSFSESVRLRESYLSSIAVKHKLIMIFGFPSIHFLSFLLLKTVWLKRKGLRENAHPKSQIDQSRENNKQFRENSNRPGFFFEKILFSQASNSLKKLIPEPSSFFNMLAGRSGKLSFISIIFADLLSGALNMNMKHYETGSTLLQVWNNRIQKTVDGKVILTFAS